MNLYTRSGRLRSLAREHNSLYVERLPLQLKDHYDDFVKNVKTSPSSEEWQKAWVDY